MLQLPSSSAGLTSSINNFPTTSSSQSPRTLGGGNDSYTSASPSSFSFPNSLIDGDGSRYGGVGSGFGGAGPVYLGQSGFPTGLNYNTMFNQGFMNQNFGPGLQFPPPPTFRPTYNGQSQFGQGQIRPMCAEVTLPNDSYTRASPSPFSFLNSLIDGGGSGSSGFGGAGPVYLGQSGFPTGLNYNNKTMFNQGFMNQNFGPGLQIPPPPTFRPANGQSQFGQGQIPPMCAEVTLPYFAPPMHMSDSPRTVVSPYESDEDIIDVVGGVTPTDASIADDDESPMMYELSPTPGNPHSVIRFDRSRPHEHQTDMSLERSSSPESYRGKPDVCDIDIINKILKLQKQKHEKGQIFSNPKSEDEANKTTEETKSRTSKGAANKTAEGTSQESIDATNKPAKETKSRKSYYIGPLMHSLHYGDPLRVMFFKKDKTEEKIRRDVESASVEHDINKLIKRFRIHLKETPAPSKEDERFQRFRYESQYQAVIDILSPHATFKHTCPLCGGLEFENQRTDAVRDHFEEFHAYYPRYQCRVCGKILLRQNRLASHTGKCDQKCDAHYQTAFYMNSDILPPSMDPTLLLRKRIVSGPEYKPMNRVLRHLFFLVRKATEFILRYKESDFYEENTLADLFIGLLLHFAVIWPDDPKNYVEEKFRLYTQYKAACSEFDNGSCERYKCPLCNSAEDFKSQIGLKKHFEERHLY